MKSFTRICWLGVAVAYIDELIAYANWASKQDDPKKIIDIAKVFYDRFHGFGSDHWMESSGCTDAERTQDGFRLTFGDRHLHYFRSNGRWVVSELKDDRSHPADSHDVAIHASSAPFSFLEGVSFAFECIDEIGTNAKEIAEKDAARLKEEANQVFKKAWLYKADTFREVDSLQSRLKAPRIKLSAKKRCVVVANNDDDVPPAPPRETMSIDVTRAAMAGVSGCYFLWDDDKIDYVGQAGCIAKRLSPSHHRLQQNHRVSVVEMPEDRSLIAESYYIWRYEPPLNGPVAESRRIAEKIASRAAKATA